MISYVVVELLDAIGTDSSNAWLRFFAIDFKYNGNSSIKIKYSPFLPFTGETFGISQAVIGLTILAAGNCLPEAISSIITVRRGDNGVGVSNSLGSCTLDILLSLGVPWLIRNLMHPNEDGVILRSSSIRYTTILLFLSILLLYLILTLARYRLHATVGLSLLGAYTILAIISLLFETNVIPLPVFG